MIKRTSVVLLILLFTSFQVSAKNLLSDNNSLAVQQQHLTVTGTVVDNFGDPLPGVAIIIKGTSTGVVTDANGRYSLPNVPNNASLEFTFVGMRTEEIPVTGRSAINVTMNEEAISLQEVVAVGYGTMRKSDLTGSVSSVAGKDLVSSPVMRVDQALQGRAAGVSVQNTDGEPGGNVTIRVRGGTSITGGNDALVVVDGMQGGNLSTINPNDIESMEVLKDASATAIYGARGANGVILITTKKGVIGKPSLFYSYSLGLQNLAKKIELLNAGDFARKSNAYAASQNGTQSSPIIPVLPFTEAEITNYDKNGGVDWQDEIYRQGILNNHLLSISGGTVNTKYFVSAGFIDQNGILIGTKYNRFTLRSNVETVFNSWVKAGVNLSLIKDKGNVPPTGEGTYYGDILGQVVNTVVRFDPLTPVYDENGNYNFKALRGGPDKTKGYADLDVWNPVALALETKATKNNNNNDINAFFEFTPLQGLSLRITGSASTGNMDNKIYYGSLTQPGFGTKGRGKLEFSKYEYYQNSNILTYDNTFSEKHRLTLTGVAEQQISKDNFTFIDAQGFFSDDTGINDLGGAQIINERYNEQSKKTINSLLGRINYAYDNKYLITVSYRADGSSVFGENTKWGYFPSTALAWKASEESFIKDLNIFSDLKFRVSWGKTGNQGISPYQTLSSVGSGNNYPYLGDGSLSIGYVMVNAPNKDLKWETTAQTDLGLDLGFFNQRLTANVDVYKKTTTDLLLNTTLPSYTGFASVISNVGSIENKGLEITLGGTPISRRDFNWTTTANISFNRSKVLALATDAPLEVVTNTGGGYNIWRRGAWALKYLIVGQPVEQMYGYVNLGTWSEAEREEALKYGQLPGDMKWKDVNGDGVIDKEGDGNEIIGNATPDFIFGWNNNLTIKNFALTFLIQGTQGNDIFNAVRIKTEDPGVGLSTNLNNRWTIDNQNTNVPAFTDSQTRNRELAGHSSKIRIGNDRRYGKYVEDGSYIRLKNVTLTYNVPRNLLNKVHISELSIFVSGSNLLTFTNYTGYDPEVSSFNRGSRVRAGGLGIDLSNYPTSKTYTFGVNLTF